MSISPTPSDRSPPSVPGRDRVSSDSSVGSVREALQGAIPLEHMLTLPIPPATATSTPTASTPSTTSSSPLPEEEPDLPYEPTPLEESIRSDYPYGESEPLQDTSHQQRAAGSKLSDNVDYIDTLTSRMTSGLPVAHPMLTPEAELRARPASDWNDVAQGSTVLAKMAREADIHAVKALGIRPSATIIAGGVNAFLESDRSSDIQMRVAERVVRTLYGEAGMTLLANLRTENEMTMDQMLNYIEEEHFWS